MRKLRKKYRYKLIPLGGLLILIFYSFYKIYSSHSNTVLEQQQSQINTIATTGGYYMKSYMYEKNQEFSYLFNIDELPEDRDSVKRKINEQIKNYLKDYPTYFDFLKYYPLDEVVANSPISFIPTDKLIGLVAKSYNTKGYMVGPCVQVNEHNIGIYLVKGIYSPMKKHGVVLARINLKNIFQKTIGTMQIGEEGKFTLGDMEATFLFVQDDTGHARLYTTPNYCFNPKETVIGYSSFSIGDTTLLVSAMIPYDEIEGPIQITFRLFIGLGIGCIAIFSYIAVILARMSQRKKQYIMELQYQEQVHKGNRNELIAMFSREVAHDFNNILTPIQLYCDLLEMEKLQEQGEWEMYIAEIRESSKQCQHLAKNLLTISKGRKLSADQIYNSTDIVKQTIERIGLLIHDNIRMVTKLTKESIYMKGQETDLIQVVYNLAINASQAMEQEGGVLTISYEKENGMAVLKIEDTGCGMSEETKRQVFVPAFTTKAAGNGLGLSIVSNIVNRQNGEILVESTLGVGTLFTIRIPVFDKS